MPPNPKDITNLKSLWKVSWTHLTTNRQGDNLLPNAWAHGLPLLLSPSWLADKYVPDGSLHLLGSLGLHFNNGLDGCTYICRCFHLTDKLKFCKLLIALLQSPAYHTRPVHLANCKISLFNVWTTFPFTSHECGWSCHPYE
jgi:hypothetical protein